MLRVSENELEQFAQSCVLSWKSVCLPTDFTLLLYERSFVHVLCNYVYEFLFVNVYFAFESELCSESELVLKSSRVELSGHRNDVHGWDHSSACS